MARTAWVATAAAALLVACASDPPPRPAVEPELEYRLGSEDVVEVAIFQADGLSRTVPVRPDGRISLPLLGDVRAEGRTTRELADELRDRLAPYVQDPRVAVIVREVNAPRVYVIGEVARPGAYPLRGGMDVVQALALAGGFTPFAGRSGIVLIRKGPRGEEREDVDYEKLLEIDGPRVPRLRPGDTVYVP